MGAHILHDKDIALAEVCGLCLHPLPICQIFPKKGHGESQSFSVDVERSSCLYRGRFSYASAEKCTTNSPCTNVPLVCPICGPKKAAVWKYCMETHFRERHNLLPAHFPIKFEMTSLEKRKMAEKWKGRHQKPKKRNMKKKESPLILSEAHSSRLAPGYVSSSQQKK